MKTCRTVFGILLLLVLPRQGMPQDATGPSIQRPAARRTIAWNDTTATRLLDHALGKAAPDKAVEKIPVEHPQFDRAIRLSSATSGSENKWRTQFRLCTKEPIASGDVLVVALTLRALQGQGRAFMAFGTAQLPHVNTFVRYVDVGPQWQDFQFPILARRAYGAGEAKIALAVGAAVQTIDLGRLEVFNFKKRCEVSDFANSSSYRGIEPNAAWRKAALERIDRIRKADIRIEVVDAAGKPVPEAAVSLKMTAHAFPFGSSFNPHVYREEKSNPELVRTYEKRFLQYFNVATPEALMSWKSWDDPEQRKCLSRAMDFLAAHKIPVIGHPLVWQQPNTLPESLRELLKEKDYRGYLARWNAHLAAKVETMRGRFCEHLVINEFVDANFLPEAMTDEAIRGWYRLVRERDPRARLGILEHNMICGGLVHVERNLRWYESKVEMLLKHRIPLEVIAFQGHYQDQLMEPEQLLAILDRFARYNLPLQVTEFDVNMDDEQLQADYLRDFLLACFSHPSLELLQQWGFWEPSHWRPRAALFRADWSAKPNGQQFLDLVHRQWKTRATGKSGADGRFSVRGFLGGYEVTAQKDGAVSRGRFTLTKGGQSVRLVLESAASAASGCAACGAPRRQPACSPAYARHK